MASAAHPDEPTLFPNTPGMRTGQVIAGRYSIQRVIGSGGMATIVEATHLELGSRVAIKVLHTTHTTPESVDRFLREARAIFPLRSENVCRVLDLGRLPDGAPFIVMEYLEGSDLATGFRSKQVSPSHAASYIVQACKGLAEAHALGITHRDIKPANLFLTKRSDGSELVKVLDFGISKLRREGDESLTAEGQVLGTPRYMAPEQFGGTQTTDARADVWALGLVIYRLIVGRLPFTAISLADIYAEVINRSPEDIRHAVPGIDPTLAAVVMRCLERDPLKRFENARALGAALEPFARVATDEVLLAVPAEAPPTIDEQPKRDRRAMIVLLVIAAIATLAVIGASTYFALRREAVTPAPPIPVVDASGMVSSSEAGAVTTLRDAGSSIPIVASTSAKPSPPPPPRVSCNPPYYFDADHNKVFRPECMH